MHEVSSANSANLRVSLYPLYKQETNPFLLYHFPHRPRCSEAVRPPSRSPIMPNNHANPHTAPQQASKAEIKVCSSLPRMPCSLEAFRMLMGTMRRRQKMLPTSSYGIWLWDACYSTSVSGASYCLVASSFEA